MANPYFSFKQFTVFHHKCAMKVGIDGVLLGAWAAVENADSILDIGTGTGLIALMLAQRSYAQIDAIDIDTNAVVQANENIQTSSWSDRIKVHEAELQKYVLNTKNRYDLIVSNPPYFVNSTKAPVENRNTARHTDTLTHEELLNNSLTILKPTGRICIILPVNEGLTSVEYAASIGLHCTKQVTVFPKPGAAAKRFLLEFSPQFTACENSEIIIESDVRHQYSSEFKDLAKDYYLKL
jgi:tRNA1Val (adenine37-N6)-methyltransferase